MSKETSFRYYDASSAIPGAGLPSSRANTSLSDADGPASNAGVVVVKVAAGAGDKCVAPVRSRPKRRQTIVESKDDDEDTLNIPSVQWTSPGVTVSQLTTSSQAQFPLLAKVTRDFDEFTRGQVYLVHSCATEQRVDAQLIVNNHRVRLSIPVDYGMDVHIPAQHSSLAVDRERWRFSKLVRVKQLPLTVRVDSVDEHQHPAADAGEDDADLDLTGHELRLIAVNNARFLRANAINNGWVDQDEVTLIPDMVRVQLSTAVGLFGSSEQEWTDLMSMFARAVRHVHFYQISACPEVLCASASGLTADDDGEVGVDAQLSEQCEAGGSETLAECFDETMSSLRRTNDDLHYHHHQQQQQRHDYQQHQSSARTGIDVHVQPTRGRSEAPAPPPRQLPASSSAAAAAAAAEGGEGEGGGPAGERWVVPVVAARRSVAELQVNDSRTSAGGRPTPPVSRVKPMIRHTPPPVTAAASASDVSLVKPAVPAPVMVKSDSPTAAAVSRRKAPPPVPVALASVTAHQQDTVKSLVDVPTSLDSLTVADVARCVVLLGLGQTQADLMSKQRVDGQQLTELTTEQLTQLFHFTPLEANKLTRFTRGWRPTT